MFLKLDISGKRKEKHRLKSTKQSTSDDIFWTLQNIHVADKENGFPPVSAWLGHHLVLLWVMRRDLREARPGHRCISTIPSVWACLWVRADVTGFARCEKLNIKHHIHKNLCKYCLPSVARRRKFCVCKSGKTWYYVLSFGRFRTRSLEDFIFWELMRRGWSCE